MARRSTEPNEVNLNLIPIMNLFTALIPFLLMSAVFYRLAIIRISVPVASASGETDVAKEDDKITLNVQILPDRFELSASSDTLPPETLKTLRRTVPRPAGDDQAATHQELSKAAHEIKGEYTASDTVIVVPEDEILYEHVVGAMDAVRSIRLTRDGEVVLVSLFSRVVLSSRIK